MLVAAVFFFAVGGHWRILGVVLAIAWAPAFLFNVVSNMGVAGANRMADVQEATVKKTNYDVVLKGNEAAQSKHDILVQRRADLIAQRGWQAEVPIASIQAQIDAYPGINAQVWRRTKQCSNATIPESVAYCQEYAKLKTDLATANELTQIANQIKAAETGIENAKKELASTDAGISNAANQSDLLARVFFGNFRGDLNKGDVAVANKGMGVATAFVLALIATALTLGGALPHIMAGARTFARSWEMFTGDDEHEQPKQPDRMAEFRNRRTEDDKPASALVPQMGFVPPAPTLRQSTTTLADLRRFANRPAG